MAQLAQCFGFDLTNSFTRYVELLADFFKRVIGIHIDAEAHPEHLGFTRRQAGTGYLPVGGKAGRKHKLKHRGIDGAEGARFLKYLASFVGDVRRLVL